VDLGREFTIGKGIHNTLEAAVWGIPVLFGPNFQKFDEAKQLLQIGGALAASSPKELEFDLSLFFTKYSLRKKSGDNGKAFCYSQAGATNQIMTFLSERIIKLPEIR